MFPIFHAHTYNYRHNSLRQTPPPSTPTLSVDYSSQIIQLAIYLIQTFYLPKWRQMTDKQNFSNNSIGSLSNSVYSLNLPPWPSKPCTLVVRHISLTSCNITNLRDLCAHPILISFRSPSQPIFWISCFSIFRSQSLEFTTCHHPRISVTSYFQTSSKDILLSVILPHFSCPPCLEYLCPRALILLRLWRYINHVPTYIMTIKSTLTFRSLSETFVRRKWN